MFFQISATALLLIIAIAAPPLAPITVPIVLIWTLRTYNKRQAARRALDIDPPSSRAYEKAYNKAIRSF